MENNLRVIDLFAGVGGLSLGFEKAGFNVFLANEIDQEIAESYRLNHKNTLMINDDIKHFIENFDETIEAHTSLNFLNILADLDNARAFLWLAEESEE